MDLALFLANLVLTVALLAATLWSGRKAKRRLHYRLVVFTVLSLIGAIVQAELFGRSFVFDPVRLNVHLFAAFAALATVPGVVWTGLRLRTRSGSRASHQRWVGAFVGLVLLAVVTACWMFLDAESAA